MILVVAQVVDFCVAILTNDNNTWLYNVEFLTIMLKRFWFRIFDDGDYDYQDQDHQPIDPVHSEELVHQGLELGQPHLQENIVKSSSH